MASIPQILSKLTLLPEVKLIYKLTSDRNIDNRLFIILLDPNCSTKSEELSLILEDICEEDNDFLYRVFSFEYARQQLLEQNLFFVHGCLWTHLVYSSSTENIDLFYKYNVKPTQLDRMYLDFNKELDKVNYLMDGANYFLEKGNLRHPILLFHQIIELLYRNVEVFMMGEECLFHSLQEHHSNITTYVPELNFLFSTEEEQQTTLLGILDEANIAKTYEDNDPHEKVRIHKIQENTALMYTLVSKLFSDKIAQCRSSLDKQLPHIEIHCNQTNTTNSHILESEDDVLMDKLKELTKKHFSTLQRYPSRKELFCVNLISEGYLDTSLMISNLIKVCVMALGMENSPSRIVPEPAQNIREVLGYILDMIPYEEMDFLDKIRNLLSET